MAGVDLDSLSLELRASLLTGSGFWPTAAIPPFSTLRPGHS
ncbi:hypothetical protein QF034_000712 [Streptomyces africanus]|uniref:Uncharacterized protein n=1 Tax=Streptomyces africanus TaxID=231024 RepID=A0ABU0QGH1_9ACTN|nr:hypothetical protein [Streptomyces africanus]